MQQVGGDRNLPLVYNDNYMRTYTEFYSINDAQNILDRICAVVRSIPGKLSVNEKLFKVFFFGIVDICGFPTSYHHRHPFVFSMFTSQSSTLRAAALLCAVCQNYTNVQKSTGISQFRFFDFQISSKIAVFFLKKKI